MAADAVVQKFVTSAFIEYCMKIQHINYVLLHNKYVGNRDRDLPILNGPKKTKCNGFNFINDFDI